MRAARRFRALLGAVALSCVASAVALAQDGGPTPPAGPPVDLATPPPAIVWAESDGRDCHRYSKRRVCEGPRRVPLAQGEALDRQRALHLDAPRVAHAATTGPAPRAWIDVIPGEQLPLDLLWPVEGGRLWRGFGVHRRLGRTKAGKMRQIRGRRLHEGVDIGADPGTPIRAVNDGLVVYSDNGMGGYGNALLIAHEDGTVTLYGHCRATLVAAGELVRRGQIVAEVGDTGLAHGPHLHFEWRRDGRARDPLPHFTGRPARTDHEEPPPAEEEPTN